MLRNISWISSRGVWSSHANEVKAGYHGTIKRAPRLRRPFYWLGWLSSLVAVHPSVDLGQLRFARSAQGCPVRSGLPSYLRAVEFASGCLVSSRLPSSGFGFCLGLPCALGRGFFRNPFGWCFFGCCFTGGGFAGRFFLCGGFGFAGGLFLGCRLLGRRFLGGFFLGGFLTCCCLFGRYFSPSCGGFGLGLRFGSGFFSLHLGFSRRFFGCCFGLGRFFTCVFLLLLNNRCVCFR